MFRISICFFTTEESDNEAIEKMDKTTFKEKVINVSFLTPKIERMENLGN